MSGDVATVAKKLTGLAILTVATDAAAKAYIDAGDNASLKCAEAYALGMVMPASYAVTCMLPNPSRLLGESPLYSLWLVFSSIAII